MYEWHRQIQLIIEEIDACIRRRDDEALTLHSLAGKMGYSDFHMTKQFHTITGLSLRAYLRARRLAFALIEVRDTDRRMLDIALDYGFSSHEAFTRAFREEYGVTPAAYRKSPVAIVLRTRIAAFDRYAFGMEEIGMVKSSDKINVYFTTIPAHKLLYIRNNVSNGYWDFWQHHANVPGQDCHTVCGLIDSIPGKLDDMGSGDISAGAGHIMAYEAAEDGGCFACYPVPRWECYGCRLPVDYDGPIPEAMRLRDVPEGEYIVFEHGPFNYEQENRSVEFAIDKAWDEFDWSATDYEFDDSMGRVYYFYHDPARFWKELWPVRRKAATSLSEGGGAAGDGGSPLACSVIRSRCRIQAFREQALHATSNISNRRCTCRTLRHPGILPLSIIYRLLTPSPRVRAISFWLRPCWRRSQAMLWHRLAACSATQSEYMGKPPDTVHYK